MKTVLTIAGSDCSGGAGIQADIKAMSMNGVYGMSAITALTAQNTTGVYAVQEVTPDFLIQQIDAVFTDIRPDAVKTGMIASAEQVKVIAERLRFYQVKNLVVDPVMVATSGSSLCTNAAVEAMMEYLLPLATLVTPNIPEAEILSGMTITDEKGMEAAGKYISETYKCSVLCKGGHSINDANDMLYHQGQIQWFYAQRIDNPNTHGTGCTLSSTIASYLAKGYDISESIYRAKTYLSNCLAAMLDLGKGSGPLNHIYTLTD